MYKMEAEIQETKRADRKEVDTNYQMEILEQRKSELKNKKTKDTYYQRKAKREFKAQGFGVDNNKMWDDDD